jgi:hypothetical protein
VCQLVPLLVLPLPSLCLSHEIHLIRVNYFFTSLKKKCTLLLCLKFLLCPFRFYFIFLFTFISLHSQLFSSSFSAPLFLTVVVLHSFFLSAIYFDINSFFFLSHLSLFKFIHLPQSDKHSHLTDKTRYPLPPYRARTQ